MPLHKLALGTSGKQKVTTYVRIKELLDDPAGCEEGVCVCE